MTSRFSRFLTVLASSLCASGVACGSSSPPAAPSGPAGSDEAIPVTGSERIGWLQPAASLSEASSYTYALYVDKDTRVAVSTPTCQASGNDTFSCAAALPKLPSGRHSVELVALDGRGVEGPRAQPLVLMVASPQ